MTADKAMGSLSKLNSSATLVTPGPSGFDLKRVKPEEIEVVVFGTHPNFTGAIMVGLTPAIEGDASSSPEGALRRLLLATAELLAAFMPKVGSHQRNIHGGGVFDEDMVSPALIEALGKSSPA